MIGIFKDSVGRLRNGWWLLVFYLTLGALVVPATLYASSSGSSVSPALQALLAVIATWICLSFRRERLSSVVGTAASWKRDVPLGLALGALIWALAAGTVWLIGAVEWEWGQSNARAVIDALIDCVAVAVVEELLFRGFVFQRLIDGLGAWAAQILMALYFVLTHSTGISTAGELQVLAMTNIFAASLLFGTAYLRTRSLALPIALHFALNFVQGPLLGFGVSGNQAQGVWMPVLANGSEWWTGGAFGLEASIPGTAAIILALATALMWRRRAAPAA
ncbi:CPBP family intramembrane metalloprotease [Pyxidicoccus fallax]|uniref:CPBP family intramembrane metalloprotease n=1 Tax=Pyxidicoccus fallax TaxID=394095 RepID=A0A848LB27_9BACT|nr:type II CAAX endopeptidase family protein [Pyxidicoccus fallax]NMO13511.1 CPBP family intramembrane metalloprotease [Pyxidicoccus fallax]NPC78538.1 CPBP family intramembrane metalloprotease [Pyxidicoccus fallax]